MNEAISFLIDSAQNIPHGKKSYIQHCFTVYNLLKSNNENNDLCLAGLFHSIYGTEFYNAGLNISRRVVKGIIGDYAESVVYEFCNIQNRDFTILENYDEGNKLSLDLYKLARANLYSIPRT